MKVLKRRRHDMEGKCWCKPVVEQVMQRDGRCGQLVIHGDELSVELGLYPVLYAEGDSNRATDD